MKKKEEKENRNMDVLEAFPKNRQASAFPERIFVKTNRFLVIVTIINLAIIILASCFFTYMAKRTDIKISGKRYNYIYTIDPEQKILKPSEGYHKTVSSLELAMEDTVRKYITEWYSVPYVKDDWDLKIRPDSFLGLYSHKNIFTYFTNNQRNAYDMVHQKNNVRDVHIYTLRQVDSSLWYAYIETFDLPISDDKNASICTCDDNSKQCITCKIKNTTQRNRYQVWLRAGFGEASLANPLGILVYQINIGYLPIHPDPHDPLQEKEKFWGLPPALRPEI